MFAGGIMPRTLWKAIQRVRDVHFLRAKQGRDGRANRYSLSTRLGSRHPNYSGGGTDLFASVRFWRICAYRRTHLVVNGRFQLGPGGAERSPGRKSLGVVKAPPRLFF